MTFDLNKLKQLTEQWKQFETQWNTWWAISLYQNAYDYWKQNWVDETQLAWLQSRITSLNTQNKPQNTNTTPVENNIPTKTQNTPNIPQNTQNTDTQTQQNIPQSTIVSQQEKQPVRTQNTTTVSQNTPNIPQNTQIQQPTQPTQQNQVKQNKWALADYNFWHWTTEQWRNERNMQIAQSYIDNKKTPDALELYKNIKEQAPTENTTNIMNTVRNIQNDFNNKSWINTNPQVIWAKANNVNMSIENWQPVFKPNSISQAIAMYKEFWPNVPIDKVNEQSIKWSAAYWIISKYNNGSVEQIKQWLESWDLAPWSQSWKDMITLNWGITPNMEQAEKDYIQKQKVDVVKSSITNMVWWTTWNTWNTWNTLTTWTTWNTITKQNPIQSVQKVLANLKNKYTIQSNLILWKEKTIREDYYKAHPEVKQAQKEFTEAQAQLNKLQIAKKKLYNDIVNRYNWLTTWEAIAMANKQWRALDEQIFQATLKVNTAMSNYQYNNSIAQQTISDKYKIFEGQLSRLTTVYNSDVSQWLTLSKMAQAQANFETDLVQKQKQYETSLINWNQQDALKYAREISIIRAKQWAVKNIYKLFKWANWITFKYNVATWKVEPIWTQSSNVKIKSLLNTLNWKSNNLLNVDWTLDFSKNKELLNQAANKREASIKNNNPAWITVWASQSLLNAWKEAWIKFSVWTARPSKEWWNYYKFATVRDWIRASGIALTRWWWSVYQRLMKWKWAWTIQDKQQYAKSIMDLAWIPMWTTFKQLENQPNKLATLRLEQIRREAPTFYKWLKESLNNTNNISNTEATKLSTPEILNKLPVNVAIALWNAKWINLKKELWPTFPWASQDDLANIYNTYNRLANSNWFTKWIPSNIYNWLYVSIPVQLKNSDAERVALLKRINSSYSQLINAWVKNPTFWQTVGMFTSTPLKWITNTNNATQYDNILRLWQTAWNVTDLETLWQNTYILMKKYWVWQATQAAEINKLNSYLKEHPTAKVFNEAKILEQKKLYNSLKSNFKSLSDKYNWLHLQNLLKDTSTNYSNIEWDDKQRIINIRNIIAQLNNNAKQEHWIPATDDVNILSNISDKWNKNTILDTVKSHISNNIKNLNSVREAELLPPLSYNDIWDYNNRYNIDFNNRISSLIK